jgi:hypothetical protein
MASWRGKITRRQMATLLGKKLPVSRHRKCRRMLKAIRPTREIGAGRFLKGP